MDSAQELAVNTTVNGNADANQTDYYKVALKKGQRILVDCQAWRIDSQLDPVLTLHDANGAELAKSHDYEQRDSFLDFTAPAEGAYLVGVRDFLFTGGGQHFYRLEVQSRPHLDYVIPNAAPSGKSVEVTVYGRNLPGGKPTDIKTAQGVALEQLKIQVAAPRKPRCSPKGTPRWRPPDCDRSLTSTVSLRCRSIYPAPTR